LAIKFCLKEFVHVYYSQMLYVLEIIVLDLALLDKHLSK